MSRVILLPVLICLLACVAPNSLNADAVFRFQEIGGNVVMTSSGTVDTSNLVSVAHTSWGLAGIFNGTGGLQNHDLMGGTTVGATDTSFAFNVGTDLSPWASILGPWDTSDFDTTVTGTRPFSTFHRDGGGNDLPGLAIAAADLNGTLWTPDQSWTFVGDTFASLNMNPGIYTITDAVSGESLTYQIGIPEPGSAVVLFGTGIVFAFCRRKNCA